MKNFGDLLDIFSYGLHTGYDIGRENIDQYSDYDLYLEELSTYESDGFRQYSPFEFYAKEFNEWEDPDLAWEVYEQGVATGLYIAWADSLELTEEVR